MKTIKKIKIQTVLTEIIPDDLERFTVYISLEYQTALHLCLCGCGEEVVTPLGGSGWYALLEEGVLTMKPSIKNKHCPNHYHYVITKNVANVI